jgi:hypothetical protein
MASKKQTIDPARIAGVCSLLHRLSEMGMHKKSFHSNVHYQSSKHHVFPLTICCPEFAMVTFWATELPVHARQIHVASPPRPFAHSVAASLSDSDDEVPIPRFTPLSALLQRDNVDEVLIPEPMLSHFPSPFHSFIRPQPVPQTGSRGPLGYG